MKTYKVILPIVAVEDMVDRCVASLDIPKENLLIIDNSKNSFGKKYEDKAEVLYFPENIGCSRSWNIGAKRGADFNIIISATMSFPYGISELVNQLDRASDYGLLTDNGWHLIVIGKKAIERVGYWDENFYPAYYEDTDFMRRLKIAEIHGAGVNMLPKIHINALSSGDATSHLRGGVQVSFVACNEYYTKKWGGGVGEEKFNKPFGDKPLDYWEEHSIPELKKKYLLS